MEKTFEDQILAKLDYLLRVHTISVTKGMKQNEQIALLNRAGLPPKKIADLLGKNIFVPRIIGPCGRVRCRSARVHGNAPYRSLRSLFQGRTQDAKPVLRYHHSRRGIPRDAPDTSAREP